MKIITCSSYYGVGSSAFTDLVAEYDNVKDLSNFEFRFLHDLDGVSDLEYHLVENQNRHNSGHALKRFRRLSHFNEGNILSNRYSQFFDGDEYHRLTEDYINSVNDFSFQGWWFYDLYDKGIKIVLERPDLIEEWKSKLRTTKHLFSIEERASSLIEILEINDKDLRK